MNCNHNLSQDQAKQIHELAGAGYGRNQIAAMLDVSASAVVQVLKGKRKTFNGKLSTRQIQRLLNGAFHP